MLVQKCLQRPDLCDAAITGYPQATDEAKKQMQAELGNHSAIPMSKFFDHRYVIVVDGNGCVPSVDGQGRCFWCLGVAIWLLTW